MKYVGGVIIAATRIVKDATYPICFFLTAPVAPALTL